MQAGKQVFHIYIYLHLTWNYPNFYEELRINHFFLSGNNSIYILIKNTKLYPAIKADIYSREKNRLICPCHVTS